MTSRIALVLGATGGIGRPIAHRLAARGWVVRALHRDLKRVEAQDPFEWLQGDALNPADVADAARGASIIVHAVKPRLYRDWHRLVLPMIDNTLAAARGTRVVVPGNVYNYGPDAGSLIREDAPQTPETDKGKLRAEMERRIAHAVEAGKATALIVRAGDFFGPGAGSSWFSEAMVKPGRRPRAVRNPAKPGIGHQWVYLPDLAETIVQLVEHHPLPAFARFHMDGHWDLDGTRMAAAIVGALGNPEVPIRRLPWWMISLAAPFMPDLRELAEMKYLWERPLRLCNDRLVATLGHEPHTPLDEAVRQTLLSLGVPTSIPVKMAGQQRSSPSVAGKPETPIRPKS
jgi:nucleoside-diphosphate-sugar epimerase